MDDQLQQQLWDYVYGLLSDPETAELEHRIGSDPAVARAYAEVRLEADLLGEAARVAQPLMSLTRPESDCERQPAAETLASRVTISPNSPNIIAPHRPVRSGHRVANWIVAIAASAVVAVATFGAIKQNDPQSLAQLVPAVADKKLYTEVTTPSRLQAGAANTLMVRTVNAKTNKPSASRFVYRVLDEQRRTKWQSEKLSTTSNGAVLRTPPLPKDAKFVEIQAENSPTLRVPLQIAQEKYVARITADKPVYQPGDPVRFRVQTLSRYHRRAGKQVAANVALVDSNGQRLAESEVVTGEHGVAYAELPGPVTGGRFGLEVDNANRDFKKTTVPLFVRPDDKQGEFDFDLEFAQDSYRPGDKVVADLQLSRNGKPSLDAELNVTADIDGLAAKVETNRASDGTTQILVDLPEQFNNEARLTMQVDDDGVKQTLVESIPVRRTKLDLTFLPEGGPLVAGVPNRVFFLARDQAGRPTYTKGDVVDQDGKKVAQAEVMQEGRGWFAFTPSPNQQWKFVPESNPDGDEFPLPNATSVGVAFRADPAVYSAGESLRFHIASTSPGDEFMAVAECRGVAVGNARWQASSDQDGDEVAIDLPDSAGGVIRVTALARRDDGWNPIAERLVYRRESQSLSVNVQPRYLAEYEDYFLAEIEVRDEQGEPRAAALGAVATPEWLTSKRPFPTPDIHAHYSLVNELRDASELENVNLALIPDNKQAQQYLELVLGVDGWRTIVANESLGDMAAVNSTVFKSEQFMAPKTYDNLEQVVASKTAMFNTNMSIVRYPALAICLIGIVVILLMGVLQVADARAWTPAFAAALLMVTASLTWKPEPTSETMTAMAPATTSEEDVSGAPTDAIDELIEEENEEFDAAAARPESDKTVDRNGFNEALNAAGERDDQSPLSFSKAQGNKRVVDSLDIAPIEAEASEAGEGKKGKIEAFGGRTFKQSADDDSPADKPKSGDGNATRRMRVGGRAGGESAKPRSAAARGIADGEKSAPDSPQSQLAQSKMKSAAPLDKVAPKKANRDSNTIRSGLGGGGGFGGSRQPDKKSDERREPTPSEAHLAKLANVKDEGDENKLTDAKKLTKDAARKRALDDRQAATERFATEVTPGGFGNATGKTDRGLPKEGAEPKQRGSAPNRQGSLYAPAADEESQSTVTPPPHGEADSLRNSFRQQPQQQAMKPKAQLEAEALGLAANESLARNTVAADGDGESNEKLFSRLLLRRRSNLAVKDSGRTGFYWDPIIETDASGKAALRISRPAGAPSQRLIVDAAGHGRLGRAEMIIDRGLSPGVYAELTTPKTVTVGDEMHLPLLLSNGTDKEVAVNVELLLTPGLAVANGETKFSIVLPPQTNNYQKQISIRSVGIPQTGPQGAQLAVNLRADGDTQSILRKLTIHPRGYPVDSVFNRVVNNEDNWRFSVPQGVPSQLTLKAFPSAVSELNFALQSESLRREIDSEAIDAMSDLSLKYLAENRIANLDVTRAAKRLRASQDSSEYKLAETAKDVAKAAKSELGKKDVESIDSRFSRLLEAHRGRFKKQAEGETKKEDPTVAERARYRKEAIEEIEREIKSEAKLAKNLSGVVDNAIVLGRLGDFGEDNRKAMEWINSRRQGGGGFGSPANTFFALRAITENEKLLYEKGAASELTVEVDGKTVARQPVQTNQVVRLNNLEAFVKPGANEFKLKIGQGNRAPVMGLLRTWRETPPKAGPLQIASQLGELKTKQGSSVEVRVVASNKGMVELDHVVAEVPLPGGLSARTQRLDELVRSKEVDDYQSDGSRVQLFWRKLSAGTEKKIVIDARADVSGRFTSSPASIYRQDQSTSRSFAPALQIEIE